MFRFKQFSIVQDKSAMKVGTDGVLLGAWVPVKNAKTILDIGTGTGVIALMLAQRNSEAKIEAVEIDKEASDEASMNFKNSSWSNRLCLHQTSLESFKTTHKYDLIVSNPPYYTDTFKSNPTQRTLARHVDGLSFKSLLSYTVALLSDGGACAFVVPYKEEKEFVVLAKDVGLYIKEVARVKGRVDLPFKRSLLYFTKKREFCLEAALVIEIDRHVYTKEYIALTKEFYLKM